MHIAIYLCFGRLSGHLLYQNRSGSCVASLAISSTLRSLYQIRKTQQSWKHTSHFMILFILLECSGTFFLDDLHTCVRTGRDNNDHSKCASLPFVLAPPHAWAQKRNMRTHAMGDNHNIDRHAITSWPCYGKEYSYIDSGRDPRLVSSMFVKKLPSKWCDTFILCACTLHANSLRLHGFWRLHRLHFHTAAAVKGSTCLVEQNMSS